MITIRPSDARGRFDYGWLDTRHTFSFSRYYDPEFMGFGPLRVINDDLVAPSRGFPEHPHRDMEIISYVVSGQLAHKDSTGSAHVSGAGGVQAMTAGRGVTHSEFNPSDAEPVRLLQIWIEPRAEGLTPTYAQTTFTADQKRDTLRLIASPDGTDGSLRINQDARVFASILHPGKSAAHTLARGRRAWLQVVGGRLSLNNQKLGPGDGAAITSEAALTIGTAATASEPAEFLLFDLP